MLVTKLEEAGYGSALKGLSLSHKQDKDMTLVAKKLAFMDGGHNKFLESIFIWLLVKAPRYWWQEADTYRISTKQSESTMHTLVKEVGSGIDIEAFENGSISDDQFKAIQSAYCDIEDPIERLVAIKRLLPEGFIQKRVWCMSYKTIRNIILQRRTHRLPHWREFIRQVLEQVEHPELLPTLEIIEG